MRKKGRNHRVVIKKIAISRMMYLFHKAHDIFPTNNELSNRYIYLARRYAQRAKINIPIEWKKRICNKCKKFLYPGINCRTRMHSRKGKGSHVSLTCFECNHTTRYFTKIKKQKKEVYSRN
ncbi:MAG: ribonuclease P protein component 4 [Promethearchaeota archaeon]|jgi:ribonuclease P protein subunit RPR2